LTQKILIVEDEIIVATDLEAMLQGYGFQVVGIASTGAEAILLSEQLEPDLVLMDVGLRGGIDGIDTASEIRERWNIPAIYLTGSTSEETLSRAKTTQPLGYIAKPIRERELKLNIEIALHKHEMEKRARELEEQFFAVSIDMLCYLDFNGYFKRLNPAWEQTLGFTRKELMSKPFIEFVHPDDRERTLQQNKDVRSGGRAIHFENRYLCKDGSFRWLLWNAAPDFGQQTIYSVARDITDRKRAEEERERLVLQLQTALAEVKTLRDILPICSYCKNVRNDDDYWQTVETYITRYTKTQFSHSICPDCFEKEVEPQLRTFSARIMESREGTDVAE
jgi:PAS domain S-box-containing protein